MGRLLRHVKKEKDGSGSFVKNASQQAQDFTMLKKKFTRNCYDRSRMSVLMGLFIMKCP